MPPSQSPIRFAGLSDVGRVRKANEDKWLADPGLNLFLVTDGMGGEFAGGLASEVVVKTLPALIKKRLSGCRNISDTKAAITAALVDASTMLRDQSNGQPGLEGMGATIALALVRKSRALIAHMGDSRCYLFREQKLKRITKDHSLVQLLIDSGELSAKDAAAHPSRGQLTRFVGMPGEALPEINSMLLNPEDVLILCSDGLTGMLSEEEMAQILNSYPTPQDACAHLIEGANKVGGKDNITVLIVVP